MSGLKCAMTGLPVTANGGAIWDDGEWISWGWINQNIADLDDKKWGHPFDVGNDVMLAQKDKAATLPCMRYLLRWWSPQGRTLSLQEGTCRSMASLVNSIRSFVTGMSDLSHAMPAQIDGLIPKSVQIPYFSNLVFSHSRIENED